MNTSRSLGVDRLDTRTSERLRLEAPRVPGSSGERGSRVLEIQLIDERSLVRQTETGMWEAALDARAERKKMKETKKRKKRRKRRRRRNARPLSLARSLVPVRRARAFLRALCTTELGGLGFLRTTRGLITPGPRAAPRATPFARL